MPEQPADGRESLDLEYARLRQAKELLDRELVQERELREKELVLRYKELQDKEEERKGRTGPHKWAWVGNPAFLAILAGLIGWISTLISFNASRNAEAEKQRAALDLERQKQEATLILEAIKTGGTGEEKERATAANLVFLADAGLIQSIGAEELARLRAKAGTAVPSLPGTPGIDFKRSSVLTEELQAKLQRAIDGYHAHLVKSGYRPPQTTDPLVVRIDEDNPANAYFDNTSVVLGTRLARDPEYVLSEYTWFVLKQSNPAAFQTLMTSPEDHFHGFAHGLKFYFTCSYRNDPEVGKNYYSLVGMGERGGRPRPLFNLKEFRAFHKDGGPDINEPHRLGEIWGGALWELREKHGREKVDRLALSAWQRLKPAGEKLEDPKCYVDLILEANMAATDKVNPATVRQPFQKRKLGG